MHTITVSTLNEQIKGLLESTFVQIYVEGELSRITHHNSGHIYFTLKDSGSSISGVMFRGNASKLRFRLEEGLKVVVGGAITLYKPRGSYQINAFNIEPAGQGALSLAFEQLKKKLSDAGYFAEEIKKNLPKFPKNIALVTSATGAALQDMQRVAAHRYPLARLFVYDTVVQGDQAAPSIVNAIEAADAHGFDIIVVGRGGGSIEDLWGFNEEIVANAIYRAKTPIVSAVGHEIDWLISDMVADLRAPTPSAAMEMILPDQNELLQSLDIISEQMHQSMDQKLLNCSGLLQHLQSAYEQNSIEQRITNSLERVAQLKSRFKQTERYLLEKKERELSPLAENLTRQMQNKLLEKQHILASLQQAMQVQDPRHKNRKGYVQLLKNAALADLDTLSVDDEVELLNSEKRVKAKVLEIEEL